MATTVRQAVRRQRLKRLIWIIVIVLTIGLADFLASPQLGQVLQGLAGPRLPALREYEETVLLYEEQEWDKEIAKTFWHVSQGTSTFPIPANWLLALEEPAASIFTMPFRKRGKFSDNDYLQRLGFIESDISDLNPYGLPIGFAITNFESLKGVNNKSQVIGLNCSACHTAQVSYQGTRYVIEGGPASTDIGQLTLALGAALGQTLISAKVPLVHGRFKRFAREVLGDDAYTEQNIASLEAQLQSVVESLASQPIETAVTEGFARLDALNRIGNQVFSIDINNRGNYAAPNAPVNYPYLWTVPWFEWAQYDASIMSPLVRNAGEAMGVSANVDTKAPDDENRFSSSIPLDNLVWIEEALKGDCPPLAGVNCEPTSTDGEPRPGLRAPEWPERFPEIDQKKVAAGEALYKKYCASCHLPTLDSQEIGNHFEPIRYCTNKKVMTGLSVVQGDNQCQAIDPSWTMIETDDVLKLIISETDDIGTDPATGEVLVSRTVNTAGIGSGSELENTRGLGIDAEVCGWAPTAPPVPPALPGDTPQGGLLVPVRITDNPDESYGLALGALVQQVSEEWLRQTFVLNRDPNTQELVPIDRELLKKYTTDRPNCLQVGKGYKARPLDGIWATAPFLHNGSVPTMWDLLSPVSERPEYVLLGDIEFDPEKLGLRQPEQLAPRGGRKYNQDRYFILDTNVPGNRNTGHEFSIDWKPPRPGGEPVEQVKGVIGPLLTEDERWELIEFLKTL